jgi:hypothetical protein
MTGRTSEAERSGGRAQLNWFPDQKLLTHWNNCRFETLTTHKPLHCETRICHCGAPPEGPDPTSDVLFGLCKTPRMAAW